MNLKDREKGNVGIYIFPSIYEREKYSVPSNQPWVQPGKYDWAVIFFSPGPLPKTLIISSLTASMEVRNSKSLFCPRNTQISSHKQTILLGFKIFFWRFLYIYKKSHTCQFMIFFLFNTSSCILYTLLYLAFVLIYCRDSPCQYIKSCCSCLLLHSILLTECTIYLFSSIMMNI